MLLNCGHESTTGYGTDKDGKKICYACCADADRNAMDATGRAVLYLSGPLLDTMKVTNWPDSLSYPVTGYRVSLHNIAGRRYDIWFRDHVGKEWHGVQYGDNTQICRCKRLA